LRLRLVLAADLLSVHALHSQPEVDRYNTLGLPRDLAETQKVLDGWLASRRADPTLHYPLVIERRQDQAWLGLVALTLQGGKYQRAEVWYKLQPSYWRQGYASEALRQVLAFGFDTLALHRIEAGCAVDNLASIRTLETVGMTREGRKRQSLPLKHGWSDGFEYGMLAGELR
jgi:RimJ/RimL family protein N-acetyltransferase